MDELKQALESTGYAFAHHGWASAPEGDYGVWAEDSAGGSVWADGQMQNQSIQGTVDYFTRNDSGAPLRTIQTALNNAGISFLLNSVQFEEDTGYIHYEWVFDLTVWRNMTCSWPNSTKTWVE